MHNELIKELEKDNPSADVIRNLLLHGPKDSGKLAIFHSANKSDFFSLLARKRILPDIFSCLHTNLENILEREDLKFEAKASEKFLYESLLLPVLDDSSCSSRLSNVDSFTNLKMTTPLAISCNLGCVIEIEVADIDRKFGKQFTTNIITEIVIGKSNYNNNTDEQISNNIHLKEDIQNFFVENLSHILIACDEAKLAYAIDRISFVIQSAPQHQNWIKKGLNIQTLKELLKYQQAASSLNITIDEMHEYVIKMLADEYLADKCASTNLSKVFPGAKFSDSDGEITLRDIEGHLTEYEIYNPDLSLEDMIANYVIRYASPAGVEEAKAKREVLLPEKKKVDEKEKQEKEKQEKEESERLAEIERQAEKAKQEDEAGGAILGTSAAAALSNVRPVSSNKSAIDPSKVSKAVDPSFDVTWLVSKVRDKISLDTSATKFFKEQFGVENLDWEAGQHHMIVAYASSQGLSKLLGKSFVNIAPESFASIYAASLSKGDLTAKYGSKKAEFTIWDIASTQNKAPFLYAALHKRSEEFDLFKDNTKALFKPIFTYSNGKAIEILREAGNEHIWEDAFKYMFTHPNSKILKVFIESEAPKLEHLVNIGDGGEVREVSLLSGVLYGMVSLVQQIQSAKNIQNAIRLLTKSMDSLDMLLDSKNSERVWVPKYEIEEEVQPEDMSASRIVTRKFHTSDREVDVAIQKTLKYCGTLGKCVQKFTESKDVSITSLAGRCVDLVSKITNEIYKGVPCNDLEETMDGSFMHHLSFLDRSALNTTMNTTMGDIEPVNNEG